MALPNDPLGYRLELEGALQLPGLDDIRDSNTVTDSSAVAAYRVALALGRCRLTGTELAEIDGTLSVPVALVAGRQFLLRLQDWTRQASEFPVRWADLTGDGQGWEADDLCLGLLDSMWDSWALYVAISEAWEAALTESKPRAGELEILLAEGTTARDALDTATQEHIQTLSTITHLPYLDNCRELLSEEFLAEDGLPFAWWLDRSLEAVAQQQAELGDKWQRVWQSNLQQTEVRRDTLITETNTVQPQRRRLMLQSYAGSATTIDGSGWQTIRLFDPNGRYFAQINLPLRADLIGGQQIDLTIYHRQETRKGDPAGDVLAGAPVVVEAIPELATTLDAHGKAWFSALDWNRIIEHFQDSLLTISVQGIPFQEQSDHGG